MNEEWRPVVSFPNYEVSAQGRVRRLQGYKCRTTRVLKATLHKKNKRLYVSLSYEGCVTKRYVARIVAEAFLGPKPEKHDLHHIDGDTANDSCANLEYVPKTLHRSAHNSGEANNAAVLCWNDVNTIRILYNKASFSQRGLATIYGVGKTTVARIVNRTHWRER